MLVLSLALSKGSGTFEVAATIDEQLSSNVMERSRVEVFNWMDIL